MKIQINAYDYNVVYMFYRNPEFVRCALYLGMGFGEIKSLLDDFRSRDAIQNVITTAYNLGISKEDGIVVVD